MTESFTNHHFELRKRKELIMTLSMLTCKMFLSVALLGPLLVITPTVAAAELPDYLVSKGGVIYPQTGDSMQVIFHTPRDITDYLKPGMLLGVLPEDCISASHGTIGSYYICHYDLALKPEEYEGKTVYKVIEMN
jgi:hypothetical protein